MKAETGAAVHWVKWMHTNGYLGVFLLLGVLDPSGLVQEGRVDVFIGSRR